MHVNFYKLNRLSHNSTESKQSINHRFQHRTIGWLASFSLLYVLVLHFCQLHSLTVIWTPARVACFTNRFRRNDSETE